MIFGTRELALARRRGHRRKKSRSYRCVVMGIGLLMGVLIVAVRLVPPLSVDNLEIVQMAGTVNVAAYVKLAVIGNDHPHMGARDAAGNWGFVHDVTSLRRNPPIFPFSEELCDEQHKSYGIVREMVTLPSTAHAKGSKLLCLVFHPHGEPAGMNTESILAIRETWGPKCDGFMVGSTQTHPELDRVDLPYQGPNDYNSDWQRVRSLLSYAYDNYYDQYDWFHVATDETFVIVENLRLYLDSDEILAAQNGGTHLTTGPKSFQTPLYLGRRFAYGGKRSTIFNDGASYTLNKAALKKLVVDGFPYHFQDTITSSHDTVVANIFRSMGILPFDSKDELGGERYNPFRVRCAMATFLGSHFTNKTILSQDIIGNTFHQ